MKKLRLTSFCLAFVMVVALMVPALSVITFATETPVGNAPSGSMPATLPGAKTEEWLGHAGSGNNKYFPTGLALDGALVGKTYTYSDNLLSAAMQTPAGSGDQAKITAQTPVKADGSVAGLLLKVKAGGSNTATYHNNGVGFGFTANGVKYAVASNHATNETYNVQQTYMYDSHFFENEWVYYRDVGMAVNYSTSGGKYVITDGYGTATGLSGNGSHIAFRAPCGFDGYVYVPLEEIYALNNQSATSYLRQAVKYGVANVAADLIAGGISEVGLGKSWGEQITLEGLYYVYVEGFDSQADVLPGANVTFFDAINYKDPRGAATGKVKVDDVEYPTKWGGWGGFNTQESIGLEKNTMFTPGLIGATFTATSVKNTVAAVEGTSYSKMEKMTLKKTGTDDVNYVGADGFLIDVAVSGTSTNNAVIVIVEVDGVAYFNICRKDTAKDTWTGHETYFRWDGTSKWYATSARHYLQGGKDTYGDEQVIRLPANFNGQMYIPVEHFTQDYVDYARTTAGDFSRLTQAKLAAATEVNVYTAQIWNQSGVTLEDVSMVHATSKANELPSTLPEKQNVMYRSNLRYDSIGTVANWTIDDAQAWQGANAMPDYLWGAKYTTTTAYEAAVNTATGNVTVASLKKALAGKDIRNLAGVFVEYNATAESGAAAYGTASGLWNLGFNLSVTGADGRAYTTSALGNGNNHHFVHQGNDGWTVETYNGSNRLILGQTAISFLPISSFAGTREDYAENKVVVGAGVTFLYEQVNDFAARGGDALSNLVVNKAGWGEGDKGIAPYIVSVKLVWVEGFGDAMDAARVPTNLPVNAETYLYENTREYAIASSGTMTNDGFYGNFLPFTGMGTVAENANNKKALNSAFEGKSIVSTSLLTNAEILAQGTTGHTSAVVTAGYGVGYSAAGAQLNFAVPAGKQTVSQYAAGILIYLDNTVDANAKQQGTGINVGVTLGDGSYYSMFTHTGTTPAGKFETWPATPKVAYRYDYTTGSWMAQIDTSKLRIISGFDGYVFIPFSTLGLESLGAETLLDMEDVIRCGITNVRIDGYWGGSLVVKSIELASVEVDASAYALSAAPFLGEDISLGIKVDSAFNPYNLDVTMTVEQEGRTEAVELTENDGIFLYEGIKAQNMTDNIKVTMKIAGETVKVVENYSIKAYAESLIANSADAKAVALAEAMLQYGAAAQKVAGYKLDDLATVLKDFSATTPDGNVSGTATVKVSAQLDKEIGLTIKGVAGTVVATISDGVNSRTFTVQSPVDGTVILEGIGANELANTITLTVGDTVVKTLSVNAYLAVVAGNASNSPEEITLAKALYEYGVAAAAYAPASY